MPLEMPKNINIGLPPQLEASRGSLFEAVLLIVVCALFAWFLIFPKKAQIEAKETQLASYLEEQGKISGNLEALNKMIKDLKTHTEDIKKLDDALPLDGKTIEIQLLLKKLASDAGVVLGDVNVSSKADGVVAGNTQLLNDPYGTDRSLQKLVGSVYVIGSFSQLQSFLKKIETTGRVIQVISADISASQADALSMQLGIESYYFAP